MTTSIILAEPYAGLQAQALGLAEAAGLAPRVVALEPQVPWRYVTARLWPAPLRAVGLAGVEEDLVIGAGGTAAVVAAALALAGAAPGAAPGATVDPGAASADETRRGST